MLEENKALVRRHTEVFWNEQTLDIHDEIHAPGFVFHDADSPPMSGAAFFQFVRTYLDAFPDLKFTIVDLIAEGDRVVQWWTSVGTHTGDLMGIPATGKQVTSTGIGIFRVVDGLIEEEWENWSAMSMMQQLGVIPPMGGGG
jgi:steroid delta-isomerase-like uncharacterized protein